MNEDLAASDNRRAAGQVPSEAPLVDLALSVLHLDLENSRIGVATDEAEATEMLWTETESKICALGEHISQNGLNPAEPWYVIPRDEGGYTVVEGNRRLLAIRSLSDPKNISGTATEARTRFPKLAQDPGQLPTSVLCYVFPDRDEADQWIDLKHSGPGKGEGTAQWSPKAKYNRRVRAGKPREWGPETWLWLRRTFRERALHQRIVEAENLQYTYMQRLAQTRAFRDTFRITMGENGLECGRSKGDVCAAVTKLVDDILNETLSAHKKHKAEESEAYVHDTLAPLITTTEPLDVPVPEPSRPTQQRRRAGRETGPNRTSSSERPDTTSQADSRRKDAATQPVDVGPAPVNPPADEVAEDRLFDGVAFDQFGRRVNAIGAQAKKIAIGANAEVCGVLCRVVVDLACTEFLRRHDRTPKRDEIWRRVVMALQVIDPDVDDSKKCKDARLHEAWKQSDHGSHGLAVQRMNDFVHSTLGRNAPSEVRRLNELYTPLLKAMEANLRQAEHGVATDKENRHA